MEALLRDGSHALPSLCREYRNKTNVTFHENDTVSYLEYRNLFFQPHLSNGSEDEYIVVPNILMLVSCLLPGWLPPAELEGRVVISSIESLNY